MEIFIVIVNQNNEFYDSNINAFTPDFERATKYKEEKEVKARLMKLPSTYYRIEKYFKKNG